MRPRLLIAAFVISVAATSLAGVTPHSDGVAGCEATCCESARNRQPESLLAGLCCIVDCQQPAGTHGGPPASILSPEKSKNRQAALTSSRLDSTVDLLGDYRRYRPPIRTFDSSHLYLETGALLI